MITPNKKKYVPPKATDLSVNGALGASCKTGPSPIAPQGICWDGSLLTSDICRDGLEVVGGTCAPYGYTPAKKGYCDFGNGAVEGCISGSMHF